MSEVGVTVLSEEALQYIDYSLIFLVVVAFGFFIMLVFLKNADTVLNLFTIACISFISITVAAFNLIFLGYAADELNYTTGYSVPLFGVLVILSIMNVFIVYFRFTNKNEKN